MKMDRFKKNVNTSYYSVSSGPAEDDEQPLRPQQFELGDHPQIVKPRGWPVTILVQLICALWLVPIVALLYVNLSGRVIGPSAWCLGRECRVDAFNPMLQVPMDNIARFNRNDHNLLGALQLVAKALEVWFIGIAAALVYLLTMRLAAKPGGLPIGYLTRPTEFSEVLSLLDPLLWTTGPSPFGNRSRDKTVGRRVWFLVISTVTLCILCNLMGPATAVLAIPSLQWIGTKHVGNLRFAKSNAGEPPGTDRNSWYRNKAAYLCKEAQLNAHDYSCTLDSIGYSMDAWLDSYLSSHGYQGYSQALDLTFQVNVTANISSTVVKDQVITDFVFWVPSRQTLSNMSDDRSVIKLLANGLSTSQTKKKEVRVGAETDPIETYLEYNKSLALSLERIGPITGFIPTSWYGQYNLSGFAAPAPWTVNVDTNKAIRCYDGYVPGWTPMTNSVAYVKQMGAYLKCNRVGTGWSELNKAVSFSVPKEFDAASGTSKETQRESLGVDVNIYSSDRAVLFPNGTLPFWLPKDCLWTVGTLKNPSECDFDRLFNESAPASVADRVNNVNTIEMMIGNGTNAAWLVSDFVAFRNFTTYTLDVSPITNPLEVVVLRDLPANVSNTSSIPVDPNWILAGWAVADEGRIRPGRSSAGILLEVMKSFFENGFDATFAGDQFWNHISLADYIAFVPIAHTLSLLDYKTELVSSAAPAESSHPLLYRTARMNVWGYFMASRTAIMGVVVTAFGCLVVLVQLYLGFKDRRRYRSPTQLLIAALEHVPKGEFEGKRHNERAMAQVPFHIEEHATHALRFSSLSGQGGFSPTYSRVPSGISGHSRLSSAHTLVSQGHGQGQGKVQGQGQRQSPSAFSPPSNVQSPGYFSDWTAYSPWQGQGGIQPWQGGGPGVAAGPTFPRSFM